MTSLFETLFGETLSGKIRRQVQQKAVIHEDCAVISRAHLRLLRSAANAWRKEHGNHPRFKDVTAALIATNPPGENSDV